jgi:hypothetical protein
MASHRSPDFSGLLVRLSTALEARGIPFMVIGGQAVLLHGEPRLTQDIDVTLGLPPERLGEILAACAAAELEPLPADVTTFVRETFVLPAEDQESGLRIDFIFSTTAYEAQAIARAVAVELSGHAVPFATAEDLLIHKLFAGRPRDIEDARGVLRRKGEHLDWDYLRHWAREFAAVPGRERLPAQLEELRTLGPDASES